MTRKTFAFLLLTLLSGAALRAQTADEIFAKSIDAVGGKDKLAAAKTLRMTGKMKLPQGMEAPVVMETQSPDKFRMDLSIQGMTMTQAYNGNEGWKIIPMTGKTDPERLSADEIKALHRQSIGMDTLVSYKEDGYQAEYLGKEDVEGSPTHKVKLTSKDGDALNLYFDAEQYLLIKMAGKFQAQGQEVEIETFLGDYKEAGGVLFPYSMQNKVRQMPTPVTISFDKIEVNPDIPASRFDMPKPEKKDPLK